VYSARHSVVRGCLGVVKPGIRAALLLLLSLLCAATGFAQVPLESADAAKINQILNNLAARDTLKCAIHDWKPFLDFSFRFDAGYFVRCPFEEFGGQEFRLAAYTRVTPRGGAPVILADLLNVPAVPPEVMAKTNLKRLHAELDMSGGFAIGEGEYQVEVFVTDSHHRICRKRWSIKAERNRSQAEIAVALEANTVSHIWPDPWDGKLADKGTGYRVTVLLDAVPMNPRESKLHVWDRAFLMQSLRSVLQHLPCESVRLVAFNVDQQKELYRQEHFDTEGFRELSRMLRKTELGTVSYKALQRGPEGVAFLADLARRELSDAQPADVVIFLGPTVRMSQQVAHSFPRGTHNPHFFYFEYFPFIGANFPDAIQHLTTRLQGTTYQIHSPADFGKAMQKMVAQLDREREAEKWEPEPALSPR
jgi:hypothetical protein